MAARGFNKTTPVARPKKLSAPSRKRRKEPLLPLPLCILALVSHTSTSITHSLTHGSQVPFANPHNTGQHASTSKNTTQMPVFCEFIPYCLAQGFTASCPIPRKFPPFPYSVRSPAPLPLLSDPYCIISGCPSQSPVWPVNSQNLCWAVG